MSTAGGKDPTFRTIPILGDKTTVSRFESWSNSTLIYAFDFVKAK